MVTFVIYGDFNCPYSALASHRVDALLIQGADIEWRAVEHKPEIPPEGEPVEGEVRDEIAHEVDEVNGLVAADEEFRLGIPPRRQNTRAYVEAFSTFRGDTAHGLRRAMFADVWDPGDLVLEGGSNPQLAAEWREHWLGFDEQVVPTLVLPNGTVVPGREALQWLAENRTSRS